MKKTFNIWKNIPNLRSSTGPWQYQYQLRAIDELSAVELARAISGHAYEYKAHEALEQREAVRP